MELTMLGTGNALVTECYNICFLIDDEGQQYYHGRLWIPDDLETMEL